MSKKSVLITLVSILLILSVALFLRIESYSLPGIASEDQEFYRDADGKPYMFELDSYYNYRLTRNYIENGHLGDKIINGQEWDSYSYSPPGVPMDYPPLLMYITAFIYQFINYFVAVPLLTIAFWLPLLISPLAGIAVYFFVKRFSNNTAGIVAGILIIITPFYLLRTIPGWFDTDMFNIVFPILIVWTLMEAFHSNNINKKVFFSSLSSVIMLFFSMAWNGWQYIFYIITFFTIFYIIWGYFKGKAIKDGLICFSIFSGGSLLLILIFTGYINFLKPFYGLYEFLNLFKSNPWSPWPDLYIAVSELRSTSINDLISGLGSIFLLIGTLGFFLIFLFLRNEKIKKIYLKKISWGFYTFLFIWTSLSFFSLLKGTRFIILLIPPISISAGITVGIIVNYININLKNKKNIKKIGILMVIAIVIFPQILLAHNSLERGLPRSNDDLWSSAEWIKYNTPEDTVIISEWSYGHFFSSISQRAVVFDGRSAYIETLPIRQFYDSDLTFNGKIPNTSREYWISRAFSTNNETLSAGIFRMLATSGDSAYLTLDEFTNNTTKSVLILNDILGIDKDSASEILIQKYNLNPSQSTEIVNYTHPDEIRPFVLVTYDDMIKNGYWDFYFGNWDFEDKKGTDYTFFIGELDTSNKIINSSNEVKFNLKNNQVTWKNNVPYSFIEVRNGVAKRTVLDEKSNFCVILQFDSQKVVVIDKKFENSLYVKLLLQKQNTQNFESMYKNKKVVVWKVTSY